MSETARARGSGAGGGRVGVRGGDEARRLDRPPSGHGSAGAAFIKLNKRRRGSGRGLPCLCHCLRLWALPVPGFISYCGRCPAAAWVAVPDARPPRFPLSLRFTACAGLDALLLGNRARRPKTRETRLPAVWLRFSSRCAVLRRARAPRLRCVPRARAHPHEPRCRAGLALHRCTPSTAPRLRRAESVSFFPRAWVGAPCVLLLPNAALLAATRQRANLRRRARQI